MPVLLNGFALTAHFRIGHDSPCNQTRRERSDERKIAGTAREGVTRWIDVRRRAETGGTHRARSLCTGDRSKTDLFPGEPVAVTLMAIGVAEGRLVD
jgi:hypothetical protein